MKVFPYLNRFRSHRKTMITVAEDWLQSSHAHHIQNNKKKEAARVPTRALLHHTDLSRLKEPEEKREAKEIMIMIMIAAAVRFAAGANLCASAPLPHYRPRWNLEEACSAHMFSGRLPRSGGLDVPRNNFWKLTGGYFLRRSSISKNGIRACAGQLGSASEPSNPKSRQRYHPFEDIAGSTEETSGDTWLPAAETARTIVEVNSKATLMLTGLIEDEIHENVIWPGLPYVTDEHGNIYFQVKNDEDILQTLSPENNFVQVIVGFDAMEMMAEMELLGPSKSDFGIEEIEDEDSNLEDSDDENEEDEDESYDEDMVAVLEEEDEYDDPDETLGDWAKLETMRSSHPMYFARKLAQVASNDPIDWMEQPPAGLAIQGLIRPALTEEHSDIQRHISGIRSGQAEINQTERNLDCEADDLGGINGHKHEAVSSDAGSILAEEPEMEEALRNGTSFYKLEMIKIQMISALGHTTAVEVKDFRKAQPDIIGLSATKIMSRLKAGGEKITQALKSMCWRCKGIQVEEAALISIDSLGFDLRVCSGTQIQTLRFTFNSQATSEYSAERQLNDLLFPRLHHRLQKKKTNSAE